MLELLSNLPPSVIVPVLGITFGTLALVICSVTLGIAITWQKHKTQEVSASLIESMIDQGMSGEDIERVLRAAGLENSDNLSHQCRKKQRRGNMAETRFDVKVG